GEISCASCCLFLWIRHPSGSTLFPYTTLFRSRADAEQLAVGADQRRAAPLRMRPRREERLVEHVFPVAGELALGEHRGLQRVRRSEEHTSELQSPDHLVCRLLLEKKKTNCKSI